MLSFADRVFSPFFYYLQFKLVFQSLAGDIIFNKYKQMPSLAFGNFNVREKKKEDLLINVFAC